MRWLPALIQHASALPLIGLFWLLGACGMLVIVRNLRRKSRCEKERTDMARHFREVLLAGAADGVVVMRNGDAERQYFAEGKSLYDACLESPGAGKVLRAVNDLTQDGQPFLLPLEAGGQEYILRGRPVAGRAILYFHRDPMAAERLHYREMLEALPIPAWLKNSEGKVSWANQAYLTLLSFRDLEDVAQPGAAWDVVEQGLTAQAQQTGAPARGRGCRTVKGVPHVFSLTVVPLKDRGSAGFAADVTALVRTESAARRAKETSQDMIERLPIALAIFDRDQRLVSHNSAYAGLWGLSPDWLKQRPSYGEILDLLRDKRNVPEQRNFQDWKSAQLRSMGDGKPGEECWHLPGGKSLHIRCQPHLAGGSFLLIEEVTHRLQLEASLNLLTQVQKATLDTLDRGMAIFGTDGRLVLHNALFSNMWQLSESELVNQPHFAEIAELCSGRIGPDATWAIISRAVNSAAPEQLGEWATSRRADGRTLSLSLARLPNGATVVTFTDATDLEKFGGLQNGQSRAPGQAGLRQESRLSPAARAAAK